MSVYFVLPSNEYCYLHVCACARPCVCVWIRHMLIKMPWYINQNHIRTSKSSCNRQLDCLFVAFIFHMCLSAPFNTILNSSNYSSIHFLLIIQHMLVDSLSQLGYGLDTNLFFLWCRYCCPHIKSIPINPPLQTPLMSAIWLLLWYKILIEFAFRQKSQTYTHMVMFPLNLHFILYEPM